MNSKVKILAATAAGAVGGLIAWAMTEPFPFFATENRPVSSPTDWWALVLFGAIMGAGIGGAIGIVEGMATGSRHRMRQAALAGAGIGAGGGMVGLYFGQNLYASLLSLAPPPGGMAGALSPVTFLLGIVARAAGWSLVGLFIGLAQGVASGSARRMKHGVIGGAIGGALAGALFQLFAILLPGWICRLVGMTVTGTSIGFFVGLVQDLLKQAWVVVLRGRGEGREYLLDKPVNVLGRDERSDVGVFGDPTVALRHASIRGDGGVFVIEDLGEAAAGTLVNGQRVTRQPLTEGDLIQLGGTRIEFHVKAGAAPRRARDVAPAQRRGPALSDGTCAFCGQRQDPRTGACACSPTSSPSPGFAPAAQGAGVPWSVPAPGTPSYAPAKGVATTGTVCLVAVSGPLSGQVFPLTAAEVRLGRGADQDVVLAGDATASRRHAVVRPEGDDYAIVDEGSANGTFVNGTRVTTQVLRSGDLVRIGQSEFRFEG